MLVRATLDSNVIFGSDTDIDIASVITNPVLSITKMDSKLAIVGIFST